MKNFDKIHCLSLDKRRGEWKRIRNEFQPYGISVEHFIVGKGKTLPASVYDQIDGEDVGNWGGHTSNAYWCYQAHRKILEKAIADGTERLLMLEDDVHLLSNFEEVCREVHTQLEENHIEWDLLYFGSNHKWGKTEQISANVLKLMGGTYCFHCVGIKRHMFQQLLDAPQIGPLDLITATYIQPKYECYAIWPTIAIQKPGISYVNNAYQDYTQYFQERGGS